MIATETLRADLKSHMTESVGEAPETTLKDRIFPLFEALFDQLDEADDDDDDDIGISEELAELLLRTITVARVMAAGMLEQIPAETENREAIVAALQSQVANCDACFEGLAEMGIEVDDEGEG